MSRRITLPEPWISLAVAVGGVGVLAKRVGVDIKTIWRWAHKRMTPAIGMRTYVDNLAEQYSVKRPWKGQ